MVWNQIKVVRIATSYIPRTLIEMPTAPKETENMATIRK